MITRPPLRILGGITLLLAVAFGIIVLQINTLLQPVEIPDSGLNTVLVSIAPGTHSTGIATQLQEAGLVRSSTAFRFFAKYRGLDQSLKAGNYLFEYGMTMDEIISDLVAGNVYRPTISVTIPEGLTLEQITGLLAQSGLVDYDNFFALAASTEPELGQSLTGQRYAIEGYLYPDTYEFDTEVSVEAVLERLQKRMSEVFSDTMRERAAEIGLSVHEVVTMASMVEREVKVSSERKTVAAVLHNRLKRKMLMQIDATVIYALGEHKQTVLTKDLEVDSPYNTYKVAGLPPGPIAAPGLESLMAVLYPADVDYLYYRAKEDGSGEHYFANTYGEHQKNYSLVLKNRQNR